MKIYSLIGFVLSSYIYWWKSLHWEIFLGKAIDPRLLSENLWPNHLYQLACCKNVFNLCISHVADMLILNECQTFSQPTYQCLQYKIHLQWLQQHFPYNDLFVAARHQRWLPHIDFVFFSLLLFQMGKIFFHCKPESRALIPSAPPCPTLSATSAFTMDLSVIVWTEHPEILLHQWGSGLSVWAYLVPRVDLCAPWLHLPLTHPKWAPPPIIFHHKWNSNSEGNTVEHF